MRWPIELKHVIALTKRVTVHEQYANDMEYVPSIRSDCLPVLGEEGGSEGSFKMLS
jgi:hypothetical protein